MTFSRNDRGFITGKAAFGILVILFLIYTATSYFPLVNLPFSLDGKVKQLSQDWLRTPPRYRRQSELKQFKQNVEAAINQLLAPDHEFNIDDLVLEASVRSTKVKVQLSYTIVINYLGIQQRYEKELLIEEAAWKF
ncbi:MAG TPA: hypothetical protein VMX35_16425 [Acidobacteriota bacterium]|nr:hypothetical protein [Acidobacteriota bacterium]